MKPLKNITTSDGSDLERIDPRTVSARYLDPKTAYWLGQLPDCGGVVGAMKVMGLNPEEYQVQ
jgi:hypothetical protein